MNRSNTQHTFTLGEFVQQMFPDKTLSGQTVDVILFAWVWEDLKIGRLEPASSTRG